MFLKSYKASFHWILSTLVSISNFNAPFYYKNLLFGCDFENSYVGRKHLKKKVICSRNSFMVETEKWKKISKESFNRFDNPQNLFQNDNSLKCFSIILISSIRKSQKSKTVIQCKDPPVTCSSKTPHPVSTPLSAGLSPVKETHSRQAKKMLKISST